MYLKKTITVAWLYRHTKSSTNPQNLIQGSTNPRGLMTPMAAHEAATADAMVTRGAVMWFNITSRVHSWSPGVRLGKESYTPWN